MAQREGDRRPLLHACELSGIGDGPFESRPEVLGRVAAGAESDVFVLDDVAERGVVGANHRETSGHELVELGGRAVALVMGVLDGHRVVDHADVGLPCGGEQFVAASRAEDRERVGGQAGSGVTAQCLDLVCRPGAEGEQEHWVTARPDRVDDPLERFFAADPAHVQDQRPVAGKLAACHGGKAAGRRARRQRRAVQGVDEDHGQRPQAQPLHADAGPVWLDVDRQVRDPGAAVEQADPRQVGEVSGQLKFLAEMHQVDRRAPHELRQRSLDQERVLGEDHGASREQCGRDAKPRLQHLQAQPERAAFADYEALHRQLQLRVLPSLLRVAADHHADLVAKGAQRHCQVQGPRISLQEAGSADHQDRLHRKGHCHGVPQSTGNTEVLEQPRRNQSAFPRGEPHGPHQGGPCNAGENGAHGEAGKRR